MTVTDVEVGLSKTEVAEEQIKVEEKQRVLGVLPNFYVSYIPDAAPLSSKQKFKLAGRRKITSENMGKARKVMGNASAPAMLTWLRARSSEAPYCHRF